eukprot:9503765-Pyramimonas_sp.AAC.1
MHHACLLFNYTQIRQPPSEPDAGQPSVCQEELLCTYAIHPHLQLNLRATGGLSRNASLLPPPLLGLARLSSYTSRAPRSQHLAVQEQHGLPGADRARWGLVIGRRDCRPA